MLGAAGLLAGALLAWLLHLLVPLLPVHTPWTFVLLAQALALTTLAADPARPDAKWALSALQPPPATLARRSPWRN